MKKLFSSLAIFSLLAALLPGICLASPVASSMNSSSLYFGEPSTYTLKFLAPAGLKIGKIGVSFANSYVDLSGASLSVSGISGGTAIVDYDPGISGNQDLQYKLSSVYTVPSDTWITLTVSGAVNPPGPNGSVGWDYISVSDSTTANHDAFYTYNDEHGTDLRAPTNVYIRLKDAAAAAPVNTNINTNTNLAPIPPPVPTPAPAVAPAPTPAPLPPIQININQNISITTIVLTNIFIFEGSQTTDLKKIEDPKHVKDFTLDTAFGWEVIFLEEIDLTDKRKLTALENIDQYWQLDFWFLYIRLEWFEVFETPVKVKYKNDDLTGFQPEIKVTESKNENAAKIVSNQAGEMDIELSQSARVQIVPKVTLEGDKEIRNDGSSYTFKGKTSHQNLKYQLKINGQIKDAQIKDLNAQTGEFSLEVNNLVNGANFIQLYYQGEKDKDFILADEKTVTVFTGANKNSLLPLYIISGLALLLAAAGLILKFKKK